MGALLGAGLLAALLGCSSPPPVCGSGQGTLSGEAGGIPCAEARVAVSYLEALAARALEPAARQRVLRELRARAADDRAAVEAALADAGDVVDTFASEHGLQLAETRSRMVWTTLQGGGALPAATFPDAADVARTAIAPWARDDGLQLVLTEMDVEGWIRYASLAREVQGGEPLRVSVADRVGVYRTIRTRWEEVDASGKIGLVSFGAFWPAIRARWLAAPYAQQQAWIRAAPLPAPMTGTSAAYVEALTATDPGRHAAAFHAALGPLGALPEAGQTVSP
ncbi:MAG: hypothetical protein H6732_08190 [Alphaproteobacteria bacterium]|nr:hypothetical protein [Alphaproteobacteria bacterium]